MLKLVQNIRVPTGIRRHHQRRSGSLLVDGLFGGAVLAAALSVAVSVIHVSHSNERTAERNQLALIELDNVLERLSRISSSELTSEFLGRIKLSDGAVQRLPGCELKVESEPIQTPIPGIRLTATLKWLDRVDQSRPPVRMIAWKFDRQESP